MARSALYTVNAGSTGALASGSIIPLGTTIRRFGCNCQLSGNGITLRDNGNGYYDIDGNFTFTPTSTTADTYTITLYKDGVEVPGGTASAQVGGTATLNVHAMVKTPCCGDGSSLYFTIAAGTSTNTVTINNASVITEKL